VDRWGKKSPLQHEMSSLEHEQFRVIDIAEIYHGSLNSAQVRVTELFMPAIQRMAAAIILVHNHPSSEPITSPDDVAVTHVVVQAGKLLDIETLDHLVIGNGRFVSLKERGLGFESRVSEPGSNYNLRSSRVFIHEEDDLIYSYSRAQAGLPLCADYQAAFREAFLFLFSCHQISLKSMVTLGRSRRNSVSSGL
jgi:hypothetical protein